MLVGRGSSDVTVLLEVWPIGQGQVRLCLANHFSGCALLTSATAPGLGLGQELSRDLVR